MPTSLVSLHARFILGMVSSDELPAAAVQLTAAGVSSPSLIALSFLPPTDSQDAGKLFSDALAELGHSDLSKSDALKQFRKDVCGDILKGTLSPYDGAKLIWKAYRNTDVQSAHEYDAFIYAASEIEDRPRERKRFEKGIMEEAKRWGNKA